MITNAQLRNVLNRRHPATKVFLSSEGSDTRINLGQIAPLHNYYDGDETFGEIVQCEPNDLVIEYDGNDGAKTVMEVSDAAGECADDAVVFVLWEEDRDDQAYYMMPVIRVEVKEDGIILIVSLK